ncbi:UDP-N-acetylmuramoylalanyl-D-glutamate--2,6-diaminopimelate ligase [Microcella putealis]|uniref:UDP-N-acetylmuramyl-tripeptide synthetase n=1 Tax=Microcella putealis TaxID=337005 RepID=A0A4Q7LIE5_9MICO|nr:UDP-N-acetylmuramoyl-L-alanyl-D-glutamate--2,6-diaminopimelate ligase [Microcella putealis]RZS54335.1 UDP-N-acetylmuramoylalanyl-D-glutamate--2,6-diaminopimelate ligase [Microcella putealis]TQM24911.1 UDP-N-acetylmuramoylalanyl-D-glutamate--2,6-diaminopimelate ligase [Microcella putealis]
MADRPSDVFRPEHPTPRELGNLLAEFGDVRVVTGDVTGQLTGVTLASGDVRPGDLYVGIRGAHRHGAEFAADAVRAGAVAVMTDDEGAALAAASGVPILAVENPRARLGAISAWVYGTEENPAALYGVTGTNGKTSTVYLLKGILTQLGETAGLTSTAERHIGDRVVTSTLTTPEATEMHAMLARMREVGVTSVAVEVSAQALSRHRVDGLVHDVAGFTNLSHDHLDDYGDMEGYFAAKLPLFQPDRSRRAVVSLDSVWGARLVREAGVPVTTIASLDDAEADADWRVVVTDETPEYTAFTLTARDGRMLTTSVPLIGRHMAANAGLALVMLVEGGHPFERVADVVADGIDAYLPGRAERVSGDTGPTVYVDFGHSADAFRSTLEAVNRLTAGRTIMVMGASGDRDTTKRHEMGRVAADGSDVLIVTDHHPRFEDPQRVRSMLLEGVVDAEHAPDEVLEIVPPEAAIRAAIERARPGDTILWAGPGHLAYRDIRGEKVPFSARDEARAALREAGWV